MAVAKPNKAASPGRRIPRGNNNSNNQYFDVGKVGRKTGITLQDTGIRDEHGLEPVSGIFSSPTTSFIQSFLSDGMEVQESSAPDVNETLTSRRKSRLPPARQSTPRHTNIGSPKRMSSVRPTSRDPDRANASDAESPSRSATQPPTNRLLDFTGATNRNRKSIFLEENQSPFKPTKVLRRSTGPVRRDPFALEVSPVPDEQGLQNGQMFGHEDAVQSTEIDDQGQEDYSSGNEDAHDFPGVQISPEAVITPSRGSSRIGLQTNGVADRTVSGLDDTHGSAVTMTTRLKRTRDSLVNGESEAGEATVLHTSINDSGSAEKRFRQSPIEAVDVPLDQTAILDDPGPILLDDDDDGAAENEPSISASESQNAEPEPISEPVATKRKPGRPKGEKAVRIRQNGIDREPSATSPNRSNASPSRSRQPNGTHGPTSNVHLRATTPFDDAGHHRSRYGRNLIQPLQYWKNESRIWRNGDIEGIIRAEPAKDKVKPKSKKKGRRKQRSAAAAEESEAESVMPDEWEESIGVLSGTVSQYDPEKNDGDPDQPIEEDLAFAASSIVTRDVLGSDFKYAKIMTIPFFGAGVVELPPEGYKRMKNSRKMQMCFFVHEGKVSVEVGGNGIEMNEFALSKGGAWIVPRGNKYTISNPSKTTGAKIFFAQGCVVDPLQEADQG